MKHDMTWRLIARHEPGGERHAGLDCYFFMQGKRFVATIPVTAFWGKT